MNYDNALIPRGAQAALQTLATTQMINGRNITAIYNEGTIVVPTSRQDGGNIAIYNAPGATVLLQESYNCDRCKQRFNSHAEKSEHNRLYPQTCTQHNMCLSSWQQHNFQCYHLYCGVWGCAKAGVNFGSDTRYMQHFRNKHNYT